MKRKITQIKKQERCMDLALKLAEKGKGKVFPNPLVGAVLAKNGRIIAQGYHRYFGGPHAEVEAIKNAGQKARGAELYVNLEPCNHYGKTPPCTEAIIKAGIKEVHIAMNDPNPLVSGKGINKLQKHHLLISTGLQEKPARALNRDYLHYLAKKRPYVTLKWAMSIDGKIAAKTGQSKWISNEQARPFAHRLRSEAGAVIVGVNTVIKDNPRLTVRGVEGAKNPQRIILDRRLRTPLKALVLNQEVKTIIACTHQVDPNRAKLYLKKGVEVMKIRNLRELLQKLAKRGISRVLVEGGGEIQASFIEQGLADRIVAIIAPLIIGGKQAITPVSGRGINKIANAYRLRNVKIFYLGDNIVIEGEI